MEVEQADFEAIVNETSARARNSVDGFDHPLELDRRIDHALASVHENSHALSIESHPGETAKNRAGQLARRLALNPADQRRLNRELVALVDDLDQRTRRQAIIIDQLTAQIDRLLALRAGSQNP